MGFSEEQQPILSSLLNPIRVALFGIWHKDLCLFGPREYRPQYLRLQQLLVAAGVRHISNDDTVELTHVDQGRAYVAGTQRRKKSCFAEIQPASASYSCRFAVIIRIVFLNKSFVTFADDSASAVINNYCTNGAAALFVAFLSEIDGEPHEISV